MLVHYAMESSISSTDSFDITRIATAALIVRTWTPAGVPYQRKEHGGAASADSTFRLSPPDSNTLQNIMRLG